MRKKKAIISWSGGKDAALALYFLQQSEEYEVVALLTSITTGSGFSSVHQLPVSVLQQQADCIGLPLYCFEVEEGLKDYVFNLQKVLRKFQSDGVEFIVFGDLKSSNNHVYRETLTASIGMKTFCPLAEMSSEELIQYYLQSGLKAKIIVIQADILEENFVGRELNHSTIEDFPKEMDVAGELGEYHTLVYDGSIFLRPLCFEIRAKKSKSYLINLSNNRQKEYHYHCLQIQTPLVRT